MRLEWNADSAGMLGRTYRPPVLPNEDHGCPGDTVGDAIRAFSCEVDSNCRTVCPGYERYDEVLTLQLETDDKLKAETDRLVKVAGAAGLSVTEQDVAVQLALDGLRLGADLAAPNWIDAYLAGRSFDTIGGEVAQWQSDLRQIGKLIEKRWTESVPTESVPPPASGEGVVSGTSSRKSRGLLLPIVLVGGTAAALWYFYT